MTREELAIILQSIPKEIVKALQTSSYNVPKWDDLSKQYDPLKHKIFDTVAYPPILNPETNEDEFKRTPLALQKLAVNRVAQSMFSTPVNRIYNYDKQRESLKKTVDIIEEVYRIQNYIDSENVERAKKLNACCQIATVWRVYEQDNFIQGITSSQKLTHKTFADIDGYNIYPINDENGNILVISIGYTDSKSNTEYLWSYINSDKKMLYVFEKQKDWIISENYPKELSVFPVVYSHISEPVWGGESGTKLVEQLEEMESYQGTYIKMNAVPTFTIDYGDVSEDSKSSTTESNSDKRRIIELGKGGKVDDVTWSGADKATQSRYDRIRNAFFEQNQIPDTSFANMIKSNTSADNKELIFADSKAKAKDLGGEFERFFYDEINIVKDFIKVMFPSISNDIDSISVRSEVVPYSIKTKKESAEFVATAGDSMSLETRIRQLNVVDDVSNEAEMIINEQAAQANQGL